MANLGEKTAPCAVFSPKFGGGSGASGAGGGGRGSGQRQVHRCWGGTLARTASACMPQPDQVILPQVEHLSLIHISEPTRRTPISYAVFCLKKKKKKTTKQP